MKRGRKPLCPYCKSKRTIGKGYRATVTIGKRTLRRCMDCKRKFTLRRTQIVASAARVVASDLAPAANRQLPDPIAATPQVPMELQSDPNTATP
jgi:hypothetical protein